MLDADARSLRRVDREFHKRITVSVDSNYYVQYRLVKREVAATLFGNYIEARAKSP
jgi:hypothetical protein